MIKIGLTYIIDLSLNYHIYVILTQLNDSRQLRNMFEHVSLKCQNFIPLPNDL